MPDSPKHKTFQKGDELLREGETADEAYLILRGEVEIRKGSLTDHPTPIARLGKGEVIGELSMIDQHAHAATVIATEETEVSILSRAEFQRRLEKMDPLMRGVLNILVKRLRFTLDKTAVTTNDVNWTDWRKE